MTIAVRESFFKSLFDKNFFILPLIFFTAYCQPPKDHSQLHWGHFKELDTGINPKDFLFGIKPGQELSVCLGPVPKGVDSAWLKAEIYSAINLWAMTIGRSIPVGFDDCAKPPLLRVVFAKAPLEDDFIGYTRFFDGERQIFLSTDYDWEDLGTTLQFSRVPEYGRWNWQKRAAFILPIVEEGLYAPLKLAAKGATGKLRQPTFATLLHELGHAWGLCDLYVEGSSELGYHGNCSAKYQSTTKPHPDEIMTAGTRPGTARFRLSSQDRDGLLQLALRSGFPQSGWSAPTRPLHSAAVVANTLGGFLGETPTTRPKIRFDPDVQKAPQPSGPAWSVTLKVYTLRETQSLFVWEATGLGPFVQMTARDSTILPDEGPEGARLWEVHLDLEGGQTYDYRASGEALAGEDGGRIVINL